MMCVRYTALVIAVCLVLACLGCGGAPPPDEMGKVVFAAGPAVVQQEIGQMFGAYASPSGPSAQSLRDAQEAQVQTLWSAAKAAHLKVSERSVRAGFNKMHTDPGYYAAVDQACESLGFGGLAPAVPNPTPSRSGDAMAPARSSHAYPIPQGFGGQPTNTEESSRSVSQPIPWPHENDEQAERQYAEYSKRAQDAYSKQQDDERHQEEQIARQAEQSRQEERDKAEKQFEENEQQALAKQNQRQEAQAKYDRDLADYNRDKERWQKEEADNHEHEVEQGTYDSNITRPEYPWSPPTPPSD